MAGETSGSSSRLVRGLRRRMLVRAHRGDAVHCPVCGAHFDSFKDDWNRANALCWNCGSHERHRAQWLLFERRPELLADAQSLLHFAPEWALRKRFARLDGLRYVTADLIAPDVDLTLDLTALKLPNGAFDAVLCSHVLEHVDDDRKAIAELRRVTAVGGWCLVMVPLDLRRERTYEDPSITAAADREREFLQHDHVRLYAADIEQRLEQAGFQVEVIVPQREFGEAIVARCRINDADYIWLCRPRRAAAIPPGATSRI